MIFYRETSSDKLSAISIVFARHCLYFIPLWTDNNLEFFENKMWEACSPNPPPTHTHAHNLRKKPLKIIFDNSLKVLKRPPIILGILDSLWDLLHKNKKLSQFIHVGWVHLDAA